MNQKLLSTAKNLQIAPANVFEDISHTRRNLRFFYVSLTIPSMVLDTSPVCASGSSRAEHAENLFAVGGR